MTERISTSDLLRATELIAETNRGVTGTTHLSYCTPYASDLGISMPHPSYPFVGVNKRTALFENLRVFPGHIQFQILMALCEHPQVAGLLPVQNICQLIRTRYAHLDPNPEVPPPASVPAAPPAPSPASAVPPPPPAPQVPAAPTRPYDIFLSYAHEDEALMTLVRKHLVVYDRLGQIRKWWDRKIVAGASVDHAISSRISSSDVILLFISADFVASNYCYEVEMTKALSQHREGQSVVVPVILRPCVWKNTPLGSLLALPRDGRPLASWPDQDEAAKDIAEGVMRAVVDLQQRRAHAGTQ
jgi:hypothetical protein